MELLSAVKLIKSHIYQIQEASRQNRLVVFVGAGVSASSGVPTWGKLIQTFSDELGIEKESDYLKIAQIYRDLREDKEYQQKVRDVLRYGKVSCNDIHSRIYSLNPACIITTNYDDLLEQAMGINHERFYVVRQDSDLPKNHGEKLLIKMHGDFFNDNIVLTENDYLDYSKNFSLIRSHVVSMFASKLVLFVGFSFNDINLKYILREVSNNLGDKMQPVYLLTDKKQDNVMYNYFKKKHIHVVQLDEEITDQFLTNYGVVVKPIDNPNHLSLLLQKQLYVLTECNEDSEDFFKLALAYINEYGDQLPVLGKYMRFLFSPNQRSGFQFAARTIVLPPKYKKTFNIAFFDIDKLISERGDDVKRFAYWLFANRQYSVDHNYILQTKFYEQYEEDFSQSYEKLYYSLNQKDITSLIKTLRANNLDYTSRDLLLPFVLYTCGKYWEAYNMYKDLSAKMWEKRKYILYFICLYNMRAIHGRVVDEKLSDPDFDFSSFLNEVDSLDLLDQLQDLSVDRTIKILLTDMVSGKFLSEQLAVGTDLSVKIKTQREISEKGGSSINSNISVLIHNYEVYRCFTFGNYIINETYGYSKSFFNNAAQGIIDSVLTDASHQVQTKLNKINSDCIPLFVFDLDTKSLTEILRDRVANKKLTYSKEFVDDLCLLTSNIYSTTHSKEVQKSNIISPQLIGKYLKNIMLLAIYSDVNIDLPNVYDLIDEYWFPSVMHQNAKLLKNFTFRYQPDGKNAIEIINNILHSRGCIEDWTGVIANLSNIAKQENIVATELLSVRQLIDDNKDLNYIAAFVGCASKEVENEIIKYLNDNIQSLNDLVDVEIFSHLHILNADSIEQYKGKINNKDNKYILVEETLFSNLVMLSRQPGYEDIKVSVEKLADTHSCLKFLIDPPAYEDSDSVKPSWVRFVASEELPMLLSNPIYLKKAYEYLKEAKWDSDFANIIVDAVLNSTNK